MNVRKIWQALDYIVPSRRNNAPHQLDIDFDGRTPSEMINAGFWRKSGALGNWATMRLQALRLWQTGVRPDSGVIAGALADGGGASSSSSDRGLRLHAADGGSIAEQGVRRLARLLHLACFEKRGSSASASKRNVFGLTGTSSKIMRKLMCVI